MSIRITIALNFVLHSKSTLVNQCVGVSWSYGSWIYSYLCKQCISPLEPTTLCDQVCQWLATGRCFSPGHPVSSTNKTDPHDITRILLKVALNTINHQP